ncbi:MAG: retron system putative HNH endonuclease [Pseudomonadota bacterium]
MIQVHRSSEPKILRRHRTSWTHALLNAPTRAENRKREKKYRHREIKDALVEMFHGNCAYCESKISHIDYGHIEHFRPKSQFRSLTFEWTNLLLACPVCNGPEYKGQHFPEEAEGGPLINPCEDKPTEHFDFVFDSEAMLTTVVGKTTRGKTTEKMLGLNRNELRAYRTRIIAMLYALAFHAETDPYAKQLLDEARKADSEYSAFTSVFSL